MSTIHHFKFYKARKEYTEFKRKALLNGFYLPNLLPGVDKTDINAVNIYTLITDCQQSMLRQGHKFV